MIKNSVKLITISLLATSLSYGATTKSSELGEWWNVSSYDHPKTDDFLYHVDLSAGYENVSGNTDSKSYTYNLTTVTRYKQITGNLLFTKTKSDMLDYANKDDKSGYKFNSESYDRSITLDYDLNSKIYFEVGFINSKNTTFDIYNQTRKYIGAGYNILSTDQHQLSGFIAKGTEDTSYGVLPQYPSGKTDAYLYIVDYLWQFNEGVSFKCNYEILKADKDRRDSSSLSAGITVALSEVTYINFEYADKYNETQQSVNKFPHTKTTTVSLGFSF